jgi:hypothetical protein
VFLKVKFDTRQIVKRGIMKTMKRYSAYREAKSSPYRTRPNYTPRSMRRIQKNVKKHFIIVVLLILAFAYVAFAYIIPFLVGGLTYFNRYKDVEEGVNIVDDMTVAPPTLNIPFEATNTATIRITGYATRDSKVEIYVGNDLKETLATQADGSFSAEAIPLNDGNNAIYGKTVIDGKNSLPSKAIKIAYSDEKPKLTITEPVDNAEIKGGDKKVKITGETDIDNSVMVNGAYVIVNYDGKFNKEVSLNDGDNTITVQSTNIYGTTTTLTKLVKYSPS